MCGAACGWGYRATERWSVQMMMMMMHVSCVFIFIFALLFVCVFFFLRSLIRSLFPFHFYIYYVNDTEKHQLSQTHTRHWKAFRLLIYKRFDYKFSAHTRWSSQHSRCERSSFHKDLFFFWSDAVSLMRVFGRFWSPCVRVVSSAHLSWFRIFFDFFFLSFRTHELNDGMR